MKKGLRSRTRSSLLSAAVIVATIGLTACDDKADHYVAFFGLGTGAPSCAAYCVGTDEITAGGDFDVKRGDKVRFVNLTRSAVEVSLTYKIPSQPVEEDTFTLGDGKSKKMTIRQDLTIPGTEIIIKYSGHGGPNMIVEP